MATQWVFSLRTRYICTRSNCYPAVLSLAFDQTRLSPMHATRKQITLLCCTFLVYALLVATNEGEFWPFSIYPMFSQAGKSWSRAVVRTVDPGYASWDTLAAGDLPGKPYALLEHGVDPIDLSNYVAKTKSWDPGRRQGLWSMFQLEPGSAATLLVYRVNGRITASDSVAIDFVPYALVDAQGTTVNPILMR